MGDPNLGNYHDRYSDSIEFKLKCSQIFVSMIRDSRVGDGPTKDMDMVAWLICLTGISYQQHATVTHLY